MDLGEALAAGGTAAAVLFVLWILLTAGAIAFGMWVIYTIIWRAVRRGLREFYDEAPAGRQPPRRGHASWSLTGPSEPLRHDGGPRDW